MPEKSSTVSSRIPAGTIRVDPAAIAEVREDADNYLLLLRAMPGRPFVSYAASAWDKGQRDFRTRAAWDAYAGGEPLDFAPPR